MLGKLSILGVLAISATMSLAYAKDMLEDHRKDLKEFQKVADKSSDPDVKAFAAKHVPTLQEHLALAEKLPGNAGSAERHRHHESK